MVYVLGEVRSINFVVTEELPAGMNIALREPGFSFYRRIQQKHGAIDGIFDMYKGWFRWVDILPADR
jgi:hypothetical protein